MTMTPDPRAETSALPEPHPADTLSRRAWLGGAATVLGLGASSLVSTRASAKTPQKAAMYQEQPKDGKMCSACVQFVAPDSCKLVDGKISASGWCQLFTPKAA
jgi:hypothetical protein